ncbi:dihydroneopterin aldolase [Bartonella tamiae]|uniref:Dihydroneopterin aldolase n=1 Tax=Bartonella tamiae Th239 TaxID=1094558 RepID=J1JWR0_9HYPH|nr:dihydroneopterin aldolase [Bartonella tamiae]EJF89025.1 dihydroneopterin aldolase [Bartonella tamiae Th239]EJF94725.1 dihydroneopterin aldolase [Bartonella tamiae Th307]
MSKLLVHIQSCEDLQIAAEAQADIILISADDAVVHEKFLRELLSDYSNRQLHLWLICNKKIANKHSAFKIFNPDAVVLSLSFNNDDQKELATFQSHFDYYQTIAMVNMMQNADFTFIQNIEKNGFNGLIWQYNNFESPLLSLHDISEIGDVLSKTQKIGLKTGFLGDIEAPDIPRLLPFTPNWLGFCIKKPIKPGHFGDSETNRLIRALVPFELQNHEIAEKNTLGTDRIIVEDFILPIEIGAYRGEYGRQQKVRFNIIADVVRQTRNPEDMRHIFSYDLILDGIKTLVSLGHVELVETLAERIAAFILAYPLVQKVIVRVDKLELGPAAVGVEIERINIS